MPQEHGQLTVYEHRCICCTNKFHTINRDQLTCSLPCFLIWDDPEKYIEQHISGEGDKPTALELFFG